MTVIVVPTEGQVEVCAIRGERATTRIALRERLLRALAPNAVFAPSVLVRAALADVMASRVDDVVLQRLRTLGGVAWERTIDAMRETLRLVRGCQVDGSLGEIVAALDAKLGSSLLDPARAGSILARAIEAADPKRVRAVIGDDARIVSRYIVRWDPSDAAWWRALSRAGVETSIEMPWIDWPLDAERTPGPLETLLDDVTLVTGEPATPTLLEGLPLGDATGQCDASRVSIAACSDAEAQARAAGSAVIAALAAGAPIDRVAIAFANPDEDVVAPVRRVLDEIGIPFHDGVGSAPAASGIVAVALEALALGSRGLPRLEVAALLRSRYLDAATVTGIGGWAGRRALDDLARALESTPSAGGAGPAERLTTTAGDRHADLARHVAGILLHASVTRAEHVAASRHILRALGFAPSAPALAHDDAFVGLDRTDLTAAASDARGWEALRDALDVAERAARVLGESPCPHETFVHELRTALGEPEAASAAGRAGALRLARPVDLAGAEWDLLVLLEASDEALDRPRTIAGPLLAEGALARLRQRQADRAPRDLAREHLLSEIVLAAERAQKIVLAHRTRGSQGEELAPAALVRAAQQSGASREIVRAGDRPRTQREHRLALVAAGAPEIAAALAPSAARRAALEQARESWHAGRDTRDAAGVVSGSALAVLRAETGGSRPMSVTMLERFARCAFQGYAATLVASGDELARETPDAREEGNLVHEALRIAFEAIADDLRKRPRDDAGATVARALAAIDAHLHPVHAAPLRNIALLRAKAEVEQVVRAAVEEEWWDFVAAEKPIAIALGDVQLRGKMDRVDRAHGEPDRIRVVDYKRRQDHVPGSELGKKRLQLLVYGVAAAHELGAKHFDGLYLPTRAAGEPLPPSFREAWLELASEKAVTARVLEIMAPVKAGEVLPSPGPHCPTCPFDGACRKPRFALLEADVPTEGS